jgi:hypothetical protein
MLKRLFSNPKAWLDMSLSFSMVSYTRVVVIKSWPEPRPSDCAFGTQFWKLYTRTILIMIGPITL